MSSRSSRRKSNMENGNHEENTTSQANGNATTETNDELKGFTTNELTTAKAVIKDVSVVLTPVPEIESQIVADGESEKRVTRSQKKENGEKEEVVADVGGEEAEKRVTRSQTKDSEEPEVVVDVETKTKEEVVVETSKENGESTEAKDASDAEPDETEPELQFDENSDNSGKNSPASRCVTRRSHMRNLPTPKSPIVTTTPPPPAPENEETAAAATKADENNSRDESFVSTDDLSTQAEPGNDTTRANFTTNDEESAQPQQTSEFLKKLKDRSYGETLRGLSSRRTINLRHTTVKRSSEFSVPYPKRASVESISGIKRKQRSPSPEECKRVKREGGGLLSYIKSPVFGVRHHFSKDLPSSTPKLTGFRNKNSLLDGEELDKIKLEVEDAEPEKKWCSIM